MELSEKDVNIVVEVAEYVDEVYVEDRKGISQTYYVLYISPKSVYLNDYGHTLNVPENLVGYWRQKFAEDNRYESWQEQLVADPSGWCKCEPFEKVVTTTEWKCL